MVKKKDREFTDTEFSKSYLIDVECKCCSKTSKTFVPFGWIFEDHCYYDYPSRIVKERRTLVEILFGKKKAVVKCLYCGCARLKKV